MINLINIKKSFQVGEGRIDVLHGISINIAKGEFVVIMGRSGSGKSTLLHILGCLDKPTDGEYSYHGNCVSNMSDKEVTFLRNGEIGFIFQNFNLIAKNTVSKNVEKPLIYQGLAPKERLIRSQKVLIMVGLEDYGNYLPSQMSGGQQQRVAIARALVTNPSLIIADEPTGNLDSTTGQAILDILRQINSTGVTVIMVTHDIGHVQHTDKLIELSDGLLLET